MGWLEGLLTGYLDRGHQIEQENLRQAELSNAREAEIYKTLLNSTDPDVKTMAATGIMQSAAPRRKMGGLRGWMGEMEGNAIYPVLQKYITTPQFQGMEDVYGTATPPSPAGQLAGPAPASQPAAQVATQTTTPGATAPATPLPAGSISTHAEPELEGLPPNYSASAVVPGSPPPSVRAVIGQRPVYGLPHAFPTMAESEAAKHEADVTGQVRAYAQAYKMAQPNLTDAQAAQKALDFLGLKAHGALGASYVKGGLVKDPNSETGWSREVYLRSDPTQRIRIPEQPANTPEYMAAKTAATRLARYGMTPQEALSLAIRQLPDADIEIQRQLADELMTTSRAMGVAGAAGGGTTPGAAVSPQPGPQPQPGVPAAGGAAAGGGAAPGVATPPPAPGPTFAGMPGDLGDYNKRLGKPLAPEVQKAVNGARATNDLIDKALVALEPFKNQNREIDALNLAKNYRQGIYDPVASAAAQLEDLAGLQSVASSALTGGSSRALQYFIQRRQHVPKLPSTRVIEAYSMGAPSNLLGHGSRLFTEEGGWDSPKAAYDKLVQVKANNEKFIEESMNVDVPPANQPKKPTSTTATPQTGGGAGTGIKNVNGKLYYADGRPFP